MQVKTDLTDKLQKAETKDKFYQITGKVVRLLAPQYYTRPFSYMKRGWGSIERVETLQDGTPTAMRQPKRKKRVRKGESEAKQADCWTFRLSDFPNMTTKQKDDTEKQKDLKKLLKNSDILLPWGSHFGIFKKSLYRSLEAQRRLRYDSAPLGLMRIYPTWLNIGKAPCESMNDGNLPEIILETRHSTKGNVMVEVFFDWIRDRPFECILEVDSECPINEEKLVGLIKSLNTLDTVGASKRGSLWINGFKEVTIEPDELKKLLSGDPTMPVIY